MRLDIGIHPQITPIPQIENEQSGVFKSVKSEESVDRLTSHNQHGVAVAEEAIAFQNGGGVGSLQQFYAGEGADQEQQRRARQVEVRDQCIDDAEVIRGI